MCRGGGGVRGGGGGLVHNTSWSTQCAMLTPASGTFFFSYFLSSAHIITTKFVQEYHQSFQHVKVLSGPTLNVEPDLDPNYLQKSYQQTTLAGCACWEKTFITFCRLLIFQLFLFLRSERQTDRILDLGPNSAF